jgi:hypothetical protein
VLKFENALTSTIVSLSWMALRSRPTIDAASETLQP